LYIILILFSSFLFGLPNKPAAPRTFLYYPGGVI
jgi:hypothetical protein